MTMMSNWNSGKENHLWAKMFLSVPRMMMWLHGELHLAEYQTLCNPLTFTCVLVSSWLLSAHKMSFTVTMLQLWLCIYISVYQATILLSFRVSLLKYLIICCNNILLHSVYAYLNCTHAIMKLHCCKLWLPLVLSKCSSHVKDDSMCNDVCFWARRTESKRRGAEWAVWLARDNDEWMKRGGRVRQGWEVREREWEGMGVEKGQRRRRWLNSATREGAEDKMGKKTVKSETGRRGG